MKIIKKFYIIAIFLVATLFVKAQTSDMGFSFQGYAIDPDGKAMAGTAVTVQFTLSPGTFTEEHTLTTDAFGVFHAIVGNSSAAKKIEFSKLDFTKKTVIYSLKVDVKKTSGGVYTTISNEPMKAVPYARYAFNGVPVGTIIAYGGDKNNVPEGWILCDGASVAQTDYPQLYAIIGSAWGASGVSFNLPDLRGRFLRGVDERAAGTGTDKDSPRTVGSLQGEETKQHNHNTSSNGNHDHRGSTAGRFWYTDGQNTPGSIDNTGAEINAVTPIPYNVTGAHTHTISNTGGNETRPVNAAVYYIIKY